MDGKYRRKEPILKNLIRILLKIDLILVTNKISKIITSILFVCVSIHPFWATKDAGRGRPLFSAIRPRQSVWLRL
jgi:hypothetical protein